MKIYHFLKFLKFTRIIRENLARNIEKLSIVYATLCIQALRKDLRGMKGTHGYDNGFQSMRTIFMAHGPNFKRGYVKQGEMLQVDIYSMLCHLLQIQCEPHDGDFQRVVDLLAGSSQIIRPICLILMCVSLAIWIQRY